MQLSRSRKVAVIGGALGLAIAGAVAGSAFAGGLLAPTDGAIRPTYAKNEAGLSYGSLADATSPETEPDLILVETSDGKTGYAYKADLDNASGAAIESPEEAAAWEPKVTEVPVYLVDGKTKIGVFVVGGGSVAYEK